KKICDVQGIRLRSGPDKQGDLDDLVARIRKILDRPAEVVTQRPPRRPGPPQYCYGREGLRDELLARLLPPCLTASLQKVPVVGRGGNGKTTVARLVLNARRIEERYGDRRHFVKLEGFRNRGGLVARIAAGIGLGPQGRGGEDRLFQELESG